MGMPFFGSGISTSSKVTTKSQGVCYLQLSLQYMKCINVTPLLLLCLASFSLTFDQCFTAPNSYLHYQYTTATNLPYVYLVFTPTPFYTAALAVLQTTNATPSLLREDWLHFDSRSAMNLDYEGLVTGRPQTAMLKNTPIGSKVHIYLLNFQNSALGCFKLRVDELTSVPAQCQSSYYPSTYYCSSCPPGYTGVYCTVTKSQLDKGGLSSLKLAASSYSTIQLADNSDAELEISSSAAGVRLYFQYNKQDAELAGVVNYLPDAEEGSFQFASQLSFQRSFISCNCSISLGAINTNAYPVMLSISYLDSNDGNTTFILIGVIGTLLAIVAIFATLIIIKKIKQANSAVQSEIMLRMRLFNPAHSKKLSPEDIELYFPTVVRSQLSIPEPSRNEDEKESEFECVICLSSIELQDDIKVGYCKHMFHAKCLTAWFSKQQNCPYCRKDYSKIPTTDLYNQLANGQGKLLQGLDLVKSLFRHKMDATMQTLFIKDNEEGQI